MPVESEAALPSAITAHPQPEELVLQPGNDPPAVALPTGSAPAHRSKSPSQRIILISGVLIAFLFSFLGAAYFFGTIGTFSLKEKLRGSGASQDDLRYLPADCVSVFSLHKDDLLNSGVYQRLNWGRPDFLWGLGDDEPGGPGGEKDFMDNLSKATIFKDASGLTFNVLRFKKDVTADDISPVTKPTLGSLLIRPGETSETVRAEKNVQYGETLVGKHRIYEKSFDYGGLILRRASLSFCVLDGKVVLSCETNNLAQVKPPRKNLNDDLRKIIQRDEQPELSSAMKTALTLADFRLPFAFAAKDDPGFKREVGFILPAGTDEILAQLEAFAGDVALDSEVRCRVHLICKGVQHAADVKQALQAAQVQVKKRAKEEKARVKEDKELSVFVSLIDDIKITTNGAQVQMSLTFRPEVLKGQIK